MKIKFVGSIICGFPSPGEELREDSPDLNTLLVKHECTTFYLKAYGDSMAPFIREDDILVVDKALAPRSGDVVVATVNGDFTVKYLIKRAGEFYLVPENSNYKELKIISDGMTCFGVVTSIIRRLRS